MAKIDASVVIALALGTFILSVALGLLMALPVMVLWNWVAVGVLGLKEIGFFQAWGLMCLTGILFKSSATSK